MEIFIIHIVLVFVLFGTHKCLFPNNKKLFCILLAILFILLVGLRNAPTVGVDMGRYYSRYKALGLGSFLDALTYRDSSQLYYLLCWLFSKIGIPFQLFIFLVSSFCIASFARHVYIYSPSPFLSFLIFMGLNCYTSIFNIIRQCIAMAIILHCFETYKEKKYKNCIILYAAAFFIHPTVLVMIILTILSQFKLSAYVICLYTAGICLLILFRMQIAVIITSIYDETYINYYEASGSVGGLAKLSIFVLIFYYITNKVNILNGNSIYLPIFHGLVIMVILQVLSSYAYSFTRINYYYFQTVATLAIPMSINSHGFMKLTGQAKEFFYILAYIAVAIVMIYLYIWYIQGELLTNYTFFWS